MRSLFSRWKQSRGSGEPLYAALVAEARRPSWYRDGQVADTLDGRFGVLASIVALAILRLEAGGEEAMQGSVALTESFIADMDAQMRQAGFGDPSLGKQVRSMVGALAARVDRWRLARSGEIDWADAVRFSVYRDVPPSAEASKASATLLQSLDERLAAMSDDAVMKGALA